MYWPNARAPDNTRRAKSARQYPESQKRQTIPGESKAPDITRRAKSARHYSDSLSKIKKTKHLSKTIFDNSFLMSSVIESYF